MSTTALTQLQEIASELAAQEESLVAQLEDVRNRLKGVRTVLPMFEEQTASTAPDVSLTSDTVEAPIAETVKAKQAPVAKLPSTAKAKQKASKSKKTDGRAADWQKYTRPGVKNQSIPDAVKLVLATQPEKEFKIAEVMEALFKEDMPKAQYLKARNRVSNVLSGGVRAGDWHRGESSTYRMTAA